MLLVFIVDYFFPKTHCNYFKPFMKTTFEALGLDEVFLRAITDLGFETPSGVQEQAIPPLLEKDMDMVALAQTGTGKTAAFGFPMLQKIDVTNRDTQAIVLSPTREIGRAHV